MCIVNKTLLSGGNDEFTRRKRCDKNPSSDVITGLFCRFCKRKNKLCLHACAQQQVNGTVKRK